MLITTDKGVISKVLPEEDDMTIAAVIPDELMPVVETFNGEEIPEDTKVNMKINVIKNPLGIINRLNPSVPLECEFNYISKYIRFEMEKMMKKNTDPDEVLEYLLDYVAQFNEEEYEEMLDFINKLNDEERLDFINDIITQGIPLYQAPFWNNNNIEDLARLYKYTGVGRCKLKGIENEVVFGEQYFMVLKHLPEGKFSARSSDQLNIRNLPVKSEAYKQHKQPYSQTPIAIGEMENINLAMANSAEEGGMENVKEFLNCYANNEEDRMGFIQAQLTENPFDFDFKNSNTQSVNTKIAHALLNCTGYELEKTTGDEEPYIDYSILTKDEDNEDE